MVGNEENELQDLRNLRRPCFSRAEAPIGVYNGEQVENEQAALDHKLAEVRKRRMDTWDESYFR